MSKEFSPFWIDTNNTEGYGNTSHFLRRSEIVKFGKDHSFQTAVIAPTGFVPTKAKLHFGYASRNTPIKYLFPDFGNPKYSELIMSIGYENVPKQGKRFSGDLITSIVLFERNGLVRNFSILNMVVDNFTTKSKERNGILNLPADGYATECGREALIHNPQKYLDYYNSTRLLKPASGEYGLGGRILDVPQDVLELRNATLGLFSNELPYSEPDDEKFRGVYGFTLSRFEISSPGGTTGDCISMRSKADVKIKINKFELAADNHRPAQAIANALGTSTEESYRAKLGSHIYDTTGLDYRKNIGELEVASMDVSLGHSEVSNEICIQSDGFEAGISDDDSSRLMMYFYANS